MIPQNDVKITWRDCWKVVKTLRSGWIGPGKEVARLEQRLAEMHGAKYCVATTSGTMALWLAIQIVGNETVRVPAYTFPAAANAALVSGKKVVYGDVDLASMCLKAPLVEDLDETIVFVHHNDYCRPFRARKENLIEDAAQAFGMFKGLSGRFATLSFSPYKPITAGQGGAVLCDDHKDALKLRRFINHGTVDRAVWPKYGLNLRMSAIQASLLNSQLDRWLKIKERRARVHGWYYDCFHRSRAEVRCGWSVIVRTTFPRLVKSTLVDAGIESEQFYVCLAAYDYKEFPDAETLERECVYLPSSSRLTKRQVNKVCDIVLKYKDGAP